MNLREKIENDLIQALKSKKELELSVLRMLKTAIRNAEISKKPDELKEGDVLAVVRTEVKKRNDSIVEFTKGNRQELADKEVQEKAILDAYLPAQMSEEKIREVVKSVLEKMGEISVQDFGKVMGAVMKQVGADADGKMVQGIVREILGASNS